MTWGVVVIAGGLETEPLATVIGTPRKALARFAGKSSLTRTLEAVKAAGFARCVTVSGEDVDAEVVFGALVLETATQIGNVKAGVDALGEVDAVLILPADSPLITGAALKDFVDAVDARRPADSDRWYAVGVCTYERFQEVYPDIPAHPIHLREGRYLTGGLYACSPIGFWHAADLFEGVSHSRKNQILAAMRLGPLSVISFLLHRLRISDIEARMSRLLDGDAFVIRGCAPEAMADFDDVEEYEAVAAVFEAPHA